jgi:predicted transposase YbfD/YdcC
MKTWPTTPLAFLRASCGRRSFAWTVQDRLVVLDGKKIRHAHVESLNAVDGTRRWLGSTKVQEGSNEIPAARVQLAKLDIVDKIVLADAAHTQVETAGQILYEQGGEYLLTVKKNQKDLFETLETLFTEQRFSPLAHPAHPRHDPRAQPGPTRNPSARLPRCQPPAGGLSRSSEHRPDAAPGSTQG